jgi:PAS domain S-box-containing protein
MGPPHRPLRYAVAILAASVAILSGRVPGFGPLQGFFLFGAVLFSALYGGLGPGLSATGLMVGVGAVIVSIAQWPRFPSPELFGPFFFGLACTIICALIGGLHSARGEAEEAREWLSSVLGSIGDAVVATGRDGRVTFVNGVAEDLTGWSRAEAVGRPLGEVFVIVNEQTGESAEDPVARVLQTGQLQGLANHTELIARDGTRRPIADSAAPIHAPRGALTGVVLVFRDVLQQRQAELLNARMAAIVESSDEIIISKNLDGIITSWNGGAERALGYSAEEAIGRPIAMLAPPDLQEDFPNILDRIRRGERVAHYQTRRRRKDGTIIDVSLTVSPIRDSTGRIVGASKIGRDITREKRIEAERREAERRKDEFLAMLAHELRNPIGAIAAAAAVLREPAGAEDLSWGIEVVDHQAAHLSRLVADLLDVARIHRGRVQLRPRRLDAAEVLRAAAEGVRSLAQERSHQLTVDLGPAPLWVDVDPTRLEQVVVNLLMNAAKYTPDGGRLRLSARVEGDDVLIAVADNGVGIPPEKLSGIFELFAQGDRTLARSEGGLGIGLTVVKHLVELHGGSVTASSAGPGRGSEFTVRLPAAGPPERTPAGALDPGAARQAGPARVLVVDDNEQLARGMARLLSRAGHEVRVARDGPAAVEVAREYLPEYILLDIGLPGMDGYEVARRLRSEESSSRAQLIAVSGYGQPDDIRRAHEAGFDRHLVKPVNTEALMALLAAPPQRPASTSA